MKVFFSTKFIVTINFKSNVDYQYKKYLHLCSSLSLIGILKKRSFSMKCVIHKCIQTIKILCLNKNLFLRMKPWQKFTSILLSETLKLNVYFLMCVCHYSTEEIAGNILSCKLKKYPAASIKIVILEV